MITLLPFSFVGLPASNSRSRNRRLLVVTMAALATLSPSLIAQNADDANRRRRGGGEEGGSGRGNMSPQDMQARMTSFMRERLEVPDDEEWKIISERLAKVMEARRSSGGGMFGGFGSGGFSGRGGGPGGGATGGSGGGGSDGGRSSRGGRGPGGNAETVALASAVRDKLPDAEIKARLDRMRQVRKENEAKLTKAQEELRAVLSVRQEAVAVMFGLLP